MTFQANARIGGNLRCPVVGRRVPKVGNRWLKTGRNADEIRWFEAEEDPPLAYPQAQFTGPVFEGPGGQRDMVSVIPCGQVIPCGFDAFPAGCVSSTTVFPRSPSSTARIV